MVYVKPEEASDLFFDKLFNTNDSMVLAEDFSTGMQVSMYDENGYPRVVVMCDGMVVDSEIIAEYGEIDDRLDSVYDFYILSYHKSDEDDKPAPEPDTKQEDYMIADREEELMDAICVFLSTVTDTPIQTTEYKYGEIFSDVIDHTLQYLWEKHKIDPYRPMFLVDDKDQEFFVEHPYSHLIFD